MTRRTNMACEAPKASEGSPVVRHAGWLFLLCALPVLLAVASGVPLHEVPDEATHAVRASGLARGEFAGHNVLSILPDGSEVWSGGSTAFASINTVAFPEARSLADKQVTLAILEHNLAQRWGDATFIPSNNTSGNPPFFYLGSAIGLKLGKALGMRPFASFYLARLVNLIVYLALGLAAIRVARGLRPILMLVLLLPMSLWLGGSVSQDGPMIATAALATALLSRTVGPDGWRYWAGGILLACVISSKPVYLPLSAVMLTVGWNDGRLRPWRRLAGLCIAGLPPILWFLISRAIATGPFIRDAFRAGPLWPGAPDQIFFAVDPANNLRVLLADPMRFITIPWHTLVGEWHLMILRMIDALGVQDVSLPQPVETAWVWAMATAALAAVLLRPCDPRGMTFAGPAMVGIVACTVLFVYLGLYLTWTNTGQAHVEGVQGRYFIPVLTIATLGLPRVTIPHGRLVAGLLILPCLALGLLGIMLIPATIVSSYYLR